MAKFHTACAGLFLSERAGAFGGYLAAGLMEVDPTYTLQPAVAQVMLL